MGNAYEHIWSLAIEEQFYAVWPLILVFLVVNGRRGPSMRRGLLIGFAAIAPMVHLTSGAFSKHYFLPTGHIVPIAVGCLAAELFIFGVPGWVERFVAHTLLP